MFNPALFMVIQMASTNLMLENQKRQREREAEERLERKEIEQIRKAKAKNKFETDESWMAIQKRKHIA